MKFDVVVGNPPFQETKDDGERSDQASNLWSKFWSHSLKSDATYIALVTPTSWLSPSKDLKGKDKVGNNNRLWDVFNQYESYADVINVKKHFPTIGSTFGYVVVNKQGSTGLKFSDGVDTSLGFLPKSNYTNVIDNLSAIDTDTLGKKFKVDQVNSPDLRVSIPMTRALEASSIEILNGVGSPTTGSDKDKLYLYVHVKNQDEAKQVRARIQDCLTILGKDCRWAGFINIQILKMIKYNKVSS